MGEWSLDIMLLWTFISNCTLFSGSNVNVFGFDSSNAKGHTLEDEVLSQPWIRKSMIEILTTSEFFMHVLVFNFNRHCRLEN